METALIGAGVAIVAKLIGEAVAAGDMDRAAQLRQQAVDEYGDAVVPHLEQAVAQEVEKTNLGSIREDPAIRGRQLETLDRLSAFASPEMSTEDVGDLRRVADESAGVAARAAASGDQLAASRGLKQSGLSQALGMQAAQLGAQRNADSATELASARRLRQLQAASAMGGLAGNIRGQDYTVVSERAKAQDYINQFNANMRMRGVDQRNNARLGEFDADMRLKGAKNNARLGQADFYEGRADRNRKTASEIGAAGQIGITNAAKAGGGGGSYEEALAALNKQWGRP